MSTLIIPQQKRKRKFNPGWRSHGSFKKKRRGNHPRITNPEQPLLKIYDDFVKNIPKDKIDAMYYRLYLLNWE